jgi:uncharacterized repeat protein (TIGR03803 family)
LPKQNRRKGDKVKIQKQGLSEPGGWRHVCAVLLFGAATAITLHAQVFNTVLTFDGTDGALPGVLVQGFDGNFYGTTQNGGANGDGTIFKTTPAGTLTTIYSFCAETNCSDGERPIALLQGRDGNFYGETFNGGLLSCGIYGNGCGTVFKVDAAGTLTTLHTFSDGTDGAYPVSLLQGADGNFYGTTGISPNHLGTIFRITAAGTLTTMFAFKGSEGSQPEGLMQATDGNFYGTTFGGGEGYGTIFKITPAGSFTPLYSFTDFIGEGAHPMAGLVQASDGNFYGTTTNESAANLQGTVFKVTPAWEVTLLYQFCVPSSNCPQGYQPQAALIQGTDGDLYGTTLSGGNHGCGTVFQITTAGTLTTLHSFDDSDGCSPEAAMLQATNGTFYGTTAGGGPNNGQGTIFSINMYLSPFVTTNPSSGKVGTKVGILGTALTGTNGVSFNGTVAKFRVVSGSEIVATVPTGATTGFVTVSTPFQRLTSNVAFQVLP